MMFARNLNKLRNSFPIKLDKFQLAKTKFCWCRLLQTSYSNIRQNTGKNACIDTPPEELLEKMMTGLSSDIYQKSRIYKNDLIKILTKVKEEKFSSKKQGLLLLRCCSELLPDESPSARMELVQHVWDTLKEHTDFTVEHFNELLKCYIANNRHLNAGAFLTQMGNIKPNEETFQLILEAVCEAGDVNQAAEIISNMNSLGLYANEKILNSLIVGQSKSGHLENISEVLTMMKSLKIEKTVNTHVAIAKAYAWNNETNLMIRELEVIKRKGLLLEEHHIMEIVKCLAKRENYNQIPQVLRYLPETTLSNPSISPYMQTVTTQLIYQNHPLVALEIYKCLPLPSFGPMDDKGLHGRTLVRECVKASVSSQIICKIAEELMSSGRNPIALQSACEASLQLSKATIAFDIIARMKELQLPIRCHYFWPILIANSKRFGEKGIMTTISKIVSLDVIPDHETLKDYVLPYVSFSSPEILIRKLSDCGLKVSDVLSPVLEVLLSSGQLRSALHMCETFKVNLNSEKLIAPLLNGFASQPDVAMTAAILNLLKERSDEKGKDWIGRFISDLFAHRTITRDVNNCEKLLQAIKNKRLRMTPAAVENCLQRIDSNKNQSTAAGKLREMVIQLVDESMADEFDGLQLHILHPRQMNEKQLRAHLIELESKGMNTRGVLRKLLQMYCKMNNFNAAKELLDKCIQEEIFLSAGMRASIFDLYVKTRQVELAEECLATIIETSPNFVLDEHKLIDFATLLVQKGNINRGFELLKTHSEKHRIIGGRGVETNCWRLLDAISTSDQSELTTDMFEFLTKRGFCNPTNIILGPLVRAHLNRNDIDGAVNEFKRIANDYRQTPLKHELLCKVLSNLKEIEEYDLENRIDPKIEALLDADQSIHGSNSIAYTLLAALAEVEHKKVLSLWLHRNASLVSVDVLEKVSRWLAEKRKVAPLITLLECLSEIPSLDVSLIHDALLDVYKRSDDHVGGLKLWETIKNKNAVPNNFKQKLASLLEANRIEVPTELLEFKREVENV